MDFKKLIAVPIAEYISCSTEFVMGLVEVPKNSVHGDYSLPCFKLSDTMGMLPNVKAEELKQNVKFQGFHKIINCGPYLNFYIDKGLFASNVIYEILTQADNLLKSEACSTKGTVLLCSDNHMINPNQHQEMNDSQLFNIMERLLILQGFKCISESDLDIIINDFERRGTIKDLGKKVKLVDYFDFKAVIFSEVHIPPCVLIRDGSATTIVDALIKIIHSIERYELTKIIYLINREYTTTYKQLKELLSSMDYSCSEKLSMVSYGQILSYDGPCQIKVNEASHIEELISLISSKLLMEIDKSDIRLKRDIEVVQKLTSGALTSLYISSIRSKLEPYSVESLISLEGEGLPYVQYTYAKANSTLAASCEVTVEFCKINNSLLENEEAYKLALLLSDFTTVLEEAAKDLRPDLIFNFCVNVAIACENFLKNFHMHASTLNEARNTELWLLKAVIKVIKEAFRILGVEEVEIM